MPCVFTFASGAKFIPDTYTVATHGVTTEATAFPVQDGATITDHVIVKPRTLDLDMIVSPFSPEPQLLEPQEGPDRPLLSWQLLETVARTRQPFTVEVDGQTYKPAVLLGLNRQHVYDDGQSYRLTVQIQQILIATAQTVPAAMLARNIRHKGARKDKGLTPAQQAAANVQLIGQTTQGLWQTVVPPQ